MRFRDLVSVVILAGLAAGCTASPPPPPDRPVDWRPSRLGAAPVLAVGARPDPARPPLGKFPPAFYHKLRATGAITPLAQVDVWDLRYHPRRHAVITVGPVSLREWSGRSELLDHLGATHGLTPDKAVILTNWVRSGGVIWVEFGVFQQGHEWIRNPEQELPPLPTLQGFTIFGLPTRPLVFEARRTTALTIEPVVFTITNEASHAVSGDIKVLRLVQADLRTVYAVVTGDDAAPLIAQGNRVYASVVPFGAGKIVSGVPFEAWDPETDGEKYRVNLREWLAGHPVPTFDPRLEVDRGKD